MYRPRHPSCIVKVSIMYRKGIHRVSTVYRLFVECIPMYSYVSTHQPWLLDLKRHGRGPSASSVDHSPLPLFRSSSRGGVIIEGLAQFTPLGHRPGTDPSLVIRAKAEYRILVSPSTSKPPRGLTIPRSRSSNFEAG